MKILGLDEYRTLREGGTMKYFELERMPNSTWVAIFESLFAEKDEKAWVEGYCIVTNCSNSEVSTRFIYLKEKCEEANSIYGVKHSAL